ncbi:hypothetical protein AB0K12_32670 [Nonomuraea sp. NPDC049419]|uniref:hypothetical protein n=1 Tax=Nonomuraea sp. NPDC049419 TaxID=3155772 RepID=UPI00341F1522
MAALYAAGQAESLSAHQGDLAALAEWRARLNDKPKEVNPYGLGSGSKHQWASLTILLE